MGSNAEDECIAEFLSRTSADKSVAQVLLKISDWSIDEAVNLFHSIPHEKNDTVPQPVLPRLPNITSTAGGAAVDVPYDDEQKLNRYHRGFSFCSPDTLLTSLHEKIKKDFDQLVPLEDEEVVVPKDLFYLPDLLSLEPEILCFFFEDLIDIQTLERLERFHHLNWWAIKEPKNRLYPIVTRGDGNCLLHAASLGIYGVHDKELTLRSAVHKLLPRLPSLRRRWQHEMEQRFKEFGFDIELTSEQWQSEWDDILKMSSPAPLSTSASKGKTSLSSNEDNDDSDYYSMNSLNKVKYRSLEDFHVYVLANVLHRPIIVIAMSHLYSQDNQDLLAPVYFGGIYLPLERDPALCHKAPLVLAYDSSHFCPLIPMEKGDAFVPLTDCMLAALPLRFARNPSLQCEDVPTLLNRYLIISKTTILTKQLEIKAEFEHVDVKMPGPRPDYQIELLYNYLSKAVERYEMSSEYVESKMYMIWKYLSVIPYHETSAANYVYRLSSVTTTNDVVRKRIASEESTVSSTGGSSVSSTLKSNKSTQSNKSFKVLKQYLNIHRRFNSTSNIEKHSEMSLEQQHKFASTGDSISTRRETPPVLLETTETAQKKVTLKHSIKRRFSNREKRRIKDGAQLPRVPRPPAQSCITACFGLNTGDVDNITTT